MRFGVRLFSAAAVAPRIGFIGLGQMGAHMARNLVRAGKDVSVFDTSPDAMASVEGAYAASSPKDAVANADTIITMLPASAHVRSVYLGDAGVLQGMQRGALCIDSSTIDPSAARDVAAQVSEAGGLFADAPVSGGTPAAEAGTLTFMVGGDDAVYQRASKVLSLMGKNIVSCGQVGTGQVAKICNNLVLAISMIGVSEAMNLGDRLGIDPKVLAGIFNTSTARCWSSDTYNPFPGVMEGVPSSRGYTGGFGSALMAKDLGLAATAADEVKAKLILGEAALTVYNDMKESDYATKDFSSVLQYLQTLSK